MPAQGANHMRFTPERLGQPAPDLRYAPNRLHGDEIESADGTVLVPGQPDEWLSSDEVEAFIARSPAVELLLVDDTAGYPPQVYRIADNTRSAWSRELSTLYISDEGQLDPRIGWCLSAHRWTAANGREVLVFRIEC
jgi:hypothetical protein